MPSWRYDSGLSAVPGGATPIPGGPADPGTTIPPPGGTPPGPDICTRTVLNPQGECGKTATPRGLITTGILAFLGYKVLKAVF